MNLSTLHNLAISQIVLGKFLWIERRGEYSYFLITDDAEPWKRSRNWEKQIERYSPAVWHKYDSHNHILTGEKDYISNISAAYELMDATAREPFAWCIESINLADGKHVWWAGLWGDMPDGTIKDFSAQAETIPLAVAKVVLIKAGIIEEE